MKYLNEETKVFKESGNYSKREYWEERNGIFYRGSSIRPSIGCTGTEISDKFIYSYKALGTGL